MTRAFTPDSLAEALKILRDPTVVPVAGCTDLLVVDHATGRRHDAVLDLSRLTALRGIRVADGHLDIGAGCTFTELRQSPEVQRLAPSLAQVAGTIGAWQIQNRATLGGNIANASPAGDSLPVLLALGATLELASAEGVRSLVYEQFHVGYRRTALTPGELIVRVRLPLPTRHTYTAVKKVGTREAQAISKVIVAIHAEVDGGRLSGVRLGAGSVAAVPVRLRQVEAVLEGRHIDASLADAAARAARAEVSPIDDVRSTAQYRAFALGQVVATMVREGQPRG